MCVSLIPNAGSSPISHFPLPPLVVDSRIQPVMPHMIVCHWLACAVNLCGAAFSFFLAHPEDNRGLEVASLKPVQTLKPNVQNSSCSRLLGTFPED